MVDLEKVHLFKICVSENVAYVHDVVLCFTYGRNFTFIYSKDSIKVGLQCYGFFELVI